MESTKKSYKADHAAIHALVEKFQRTPDDLALQQGVIDQFKPLINRLSLDLPRWIDREEFEQDASIELLKAARKFEPGLFASFAKFVQTILHRLRCRFLSKHYAVKKRPQQIQMSEDVERTLSRHDEELDALEADEASSRKERELLEVRAVLREHLTDREWSVLTLSLSGLSNGQIAKRLTVTVHTIENIRNRIRNVAAEQFDGLWATQRKGVKTNETDEREEAAEGCCVADDVTCN